MSRDAFVVPQTCSVSFSYLQNQPPLQQHFGADISTGQPPAAVQPATVVQSPTVAAVEQQPPSFVGANQPTYPPQYPPQQYPAQYPPQYPPQQHPPQQHPPQHPPLLPQRWLLPPQQQQRYPSPTYNMCQQSQPQYYHQQRLQQPSDRNGRGNQDANVDVANQQMYYQQMQQHHLQQQMQPINNNQGAATIKDGMVGASDNPLLHHQPPPTTYQQQPRIHAYLTEQGQRLQEQQQRKQQQQQQQSKSSSLPTALPNEQQQQRNQQQQQSKSSYLPAALPNEQQQQRKQQQQQQQSKPSSLPAALPTALPDELQQIQMFTSEIQSTEEESRLTTPPPPMDVDEERRLTHNNLIEQVFQNTVMDDMDEFESTKAMLQSVDLDSVATQALARSLDKELASYSNDDSDNNGGGDNNDANNDAASVASSSSSKMTVTTTKEERAMKTAVNIISLRAPRKGDESMNVMENIISNRITSVGKRLPLLSSSSSSSSEDEEDDISKEKQRQPLEVNAKKKRQKNASASKRKDSMSTKKIPPEFYKPFPKLFSLFNNNQRRKLQRVLVSLATDKPLKKSDIHIKFFTNPNIDESVVYAKFIPKGSDEKILQDFDIPHAHVVFAHALMVLSVVDESRLSFPERLAALWIRVYCNVKKINRAAALVLLQNEFAKLFGTNNKKLLEYFKKYSDGIKRKNKTKPDVSPSDVEEEEEDNDVAVPCGFDAITIAKEDLELNIDPAKCKWSGVFHADNINSPVTISERATAKADRVKVSYCVNHKLTNCYIYNMSGRYESTYAITCTLLNALFFSERWMQKAKNVVPPVMRQFFVSMYRKCCAGSVASKAYLDTVNTWVYPSLKFSHNVLVKQNKNQREGRKKSAYETMVEDQTNDVLRNCSRNYIARVFAQLLLGMPVSSSNITDNAIKVRYAREVEMCRENGIDNIKDLLQLIADGKMNIGVQMLINSYLDWSGNTLPPLTSPEARIYEIPDKSESSYLDFKSSFPYQKYVDNYSILNPLFFAPCIQDDQKEPGTEGLYGYGAMTFWITVLAYFLCAKSIKNANNNVSTVNSNVIDAPDTPRQSLRITKKQIIMQRYKASRAKRRHIEDDEDGDAKTVWNSIKTDQLYGTVKYQDDTRPMVFIFWAKPKDKAFLYALAKAVNTIVRLHRGNDDMCYNKTAHARNIYTYISTSNPTKEYFENNTLTMYFYVNESKPMLFTKYDNSKKCTVTIKVDSQGLDFSSCESAKQTSSMDDRISGDLTNRDSCGGELGVTNYVCPKALVNLMRLKCNVLITDGTLTMDFIIANYCNGKSLYSNIKKIANHFGFVENREARQTVGSMHTGVNMITVSETESVDTSTQQYLASYPILNRNMFMPVDMRDDTCEIVNETIYMQQLAAQEKEGKEGKEAEEAEKEEEKEEDEEEEEAEAVPVTKKRKVGKSSQRTVDEEDDKEETHALPPSSSSSSRKRKMLSQRSSVKEVDAVSPKKKQRQCKIVDTTPTSKHPQRSYALRKRKPATTRKQCAEEKEGEEGEEEVADEDNNNEEEEISKGKKQSTKRKRRGKKKKRPVVVLDVEDQYAEEMCYDAS